MTISKGVVNGLAISQCYNSKVATNLWNKNPKAYSIVFRLHVIVHRLGQCPRTPFSAQIRALAKNLFLKVTRRLHR